MKKSNLRTLFTLLVFVSLSTACSSENGGGETPTNGETNNPEESGETVNNAPADFNLVNIEDGASDVELNPTLEWTQAVDPENDAVTYTVYLGVEENPTTPIESNLASLSFTFDYDLEFATTYFWKVEAKDTNGNTTVSGIYNFKTRPVGTFVASPSFGARHLSIVVKFNGKLFMIAGTGVTDTGGVHYLDDVWSSMDGENWILETDEPGFMARALHQAVVFNGKLFVIGGYRINGAPSNDIWSTVDGKNWVQEKENAEFPADWGHKLLVYNDKLWLITAGGQQIAQNRNVWNSEDGVNWSQITDDVGFDLSIEQEAIVFDNKMWVVVKDRVFSSMDGIVWTTELENAPFATEGEYSLTLHADKLILMTSDIANDTSAMVWTSANGVDWNLEYEETGFPNRQDNSIITFSNKVYVMLGLNSQLGYMKDIWTLD